MLIPGNRCGIIIGKGGETVKRLNEEYGVKMILIQDNDTPLSADKPLRITGEPDRIALVKDVIMAMINPLPPRKDFRGGEERSNEYGSRRGGGGDRGDDDRRGRDGGERGGRYNRGGDEGNNSYRGGGGGGYGSSYGGGGAGGGGEYGGYNRDGNFNRANYTGPQCTVKIPGDRAGFVIGKGYKRRRRRKKKIVDLYFKTYLNNNSI